MPTQATKLEVCNMALDVIREAPAQSLAVSTAPLRFILRNYDHVVDTTLRSYVWNFAKEKFELSADGTDPAWGWTYRYRIPNGALRVLPITENGARDGQVVAHEIVGSYIETNHTAPLRVKCIMRKANPGEWDPLFLEIVRSSLAMLLANKFTNKARFFDLARQMVLDARAKAEEIDAFEGSAEPIEQYDILRVRE